MAASKLNFKIRREPLMPYRVESKLEWRKFIFRCLNPERCGAFESELPVEGVGRSDPKRAIQKLPIKTVRASSCCAAASRLKDITCRLQQVKEFEAPRRTVT